jgi:hypothetical protein
MNYQIMDLVWSLSKKTHSTPRRAQRTTHSSAKNQFTPLLTQQRLASATHPPNPPPAATPPVQDHAPQHLVRFCCARA